jgi:cytochrome c2
VLLFSFTVVGFCEEIKNDPKADKGVGPVKNVKLSPIDPKLVELGEKTFTLKCSACHKIPERYVGPALHLVTERRSAEWIMNMILNPAGMLEKNDAAKNLFAEYLTPMTFQNVTEAEARAILEYLRQQDQKPKP